MLGIGSGSLRQGKRFLIDRFLRVCSSLEEFLG